MKHGLGICLNDRFSLFSFLPLCLDINLTLTETETFTVLSLEGDSWPGSCYFLWVMLLSVFLVGGKVTV